MTDPISLNCSGNLGVQVKATDGWKRVASFVYDPAGGPPYDRAVFKVLASGRVVGALRLVDPLDGRVIASMHWPMHYAESEIVACTLMVRPDEWPREPAMIEAEARTVFGKLTVYTLDLYPERPAVDRLADLAR